MTVVKSKDDQLEHTAAEALEAGCSFCGEKLRFPYVFYCLGRNVFICSGCCGQAEGVTVDMFNVRRELRHKETWRNRFKIRA